MFKKGIWIVVSIIAAVALSVVVGIINPSEKINALYACNHHIIGHDL